MSYKSRDSDIKNQVQDKRDEISNYLSSLEPRSTRLTYVNIIGAALATLLSGGVVHGLSQTPPTSVSWVLPLGAAICSCIATVAAGLYKGQVEARLPLLQKLSARLEGLAALLAANQITDGEASTRFQGYVEECPWIPASPSAVRGTIVEPRAGQAVPATFTASGTAHNPDRRSTLWLTVEIGGRLWPKEMPVSVDIHGQWELTVFEDGQSAGPISLSLWSANAQASRTLQAWLDDGNRTRTFPELLRVDGMKRLARVQDISVVTNKPGNASGLVPE